MPLERIVIVGNDDVASIATAMIARAVQPPFVDVCHVRPLEPAGPWASLARGATLTPDALAIADQFGWDELDLLRSARGTFLLGSVMRDFAAGAPGFLPFGAIGQPAGQIAFHHLVARRRERDPTLPLSAFVGAAIAVQAGRFAPPRADDAEAQAVFNYGLLVDTERFAAAAAVRAAAAGVRTVEASIASVQRNEAGRITSLLTMDGATVTGDLFVDCGNWLEDEPPVLEWSRWLPCDRLASMVREEPAAPTTALQLVAHRTGWQKQVVLAGATIDSFAFSSACPGEHPPAVGFRSGRCVMPWRGNCVAIGDGAIILDPVVDRRLSLALAGVARLTELLPTRDDQSVEAREYNRRTVVELDDARDIAIAHYHLNGRVGEALWDDCRAIEPPPSLEARIALYRDCGRVAQFDGDTQTPAAWTALFDALSVRPARHDSLADLLSLEEIDLHLAQVRNRLLAMVGDMPCYTDTAKLISGRSICPQV